MLKSRCMGLKIANKKGFKKMNKQLIDNIEEYISQLVDYLENNTKNSLEKIAIIEKANELVFWLQMYQDKYFEED